MPLSLCFHLPPLLISHHHRPARFFPAGLRHLSFITSQSPPPGCQLYHRPAIIKKRRHHVSVQANFNGGGGGGRYDSNSLRVLGNLALALGFTYLALNGQLGWILDTIISIWLLAVILPVIGLGVFLWWAGRDIIQDACPNCVNNFQIFKSAAQDGVQLCPFCSQPFSVQGSRFVRESARYTSNPYEPFSTGFSPQSKTGNASPGKIIDIEAEVMDAD